MKLYVAFFLVLITFSSGVAIQGQAPPRKGNQGPAAKPRTETIRICQGLAIPDGYVIIAYTTSSACPHGAYLLKKQADYDTSLATTNEARPDTEQSTRTASTTSTAQTKPTSKRTVRDNSSTPRTSTDPASTTTKTDPTSAAGVRPRRVGSQSQSTTTQPSTAQSQEIANAREPSDTSQLPLSPPTLIGSQPATALRPPTLKDAGAQPATSPANTAPDAAKSTGPEEVDEGDVVRVDTTLVTVPVSVLDRQGRFIPNLKREDFTVFENGAEQAIAYFEPAEKPFTVALLLDTSASTHFHLSEIREAAIAFAKQLRPQDRVLIVSFNDEVLLLTEVTNDVNLIEATIEENANTGNSTRLYDAVDLTIRERLNKIKGRKAIVLFTDGVDTSSQQASYLSTLREVEELDALIYPIQYDTSDYIRAMQGNGSVTITTTSRGIFGTTTSQQTYNVPTNGGVTLPGSTKADYDRADKYLHSLAEKTGGRLYQANDTAQLADSFTRIAEELRRQYTLGYYPKADGSADGDRRQIRVKVRQANLAVKARDGYVKSSAPDPNK
jgi:VWFA-related protein